MYNTESAKKIALDILIHLHFYFFNILFFQKSERCLKMA